MASAADGEEAGSDQVKEAATVYQERALIPLVEDVSEWLTRLVDDGVVLCQLIQVIQAKQNNPLKEKVKYNSKAAKGGWHARDNAATFIMWCKHFGVKSRCYSNLMDWYPTRNNIVLGFIISILCSSQTETRGGSVFAGTSRFAARYGVEPPAIIKLEKEIESDEKLISRKDISKSAVQRRPARGSSHLADVDKEVAEMTSQCTCSPEFYVEKLRDGIYALGNKRCLIRKLKGRHIMVRVGGGWDTLENYLSCHDPCRVTLFRKAGAQADMLNVQDARGHVIENGYRSNANTAATDEKFLHVRGRYKSAK
ncbi:GAS2L3 [Bugula neritina]|uniref:GAS2L3 n=1 Tax=Bugula neritina TaxID=10212 RepID=A0A7J7K9E2_BUGNE|nr:GAS2L3 [Bugula neritina]